jgi:hypothetical protein
VQNEDNKVEMCKTRLQSILIVNKESKSLEIPFIAWYEDHVVLVLGYRIRPRQYVGQFGFRNPFGKRKMRSILPHPSSRLLSTF